MRVRLLAVGCTLALAACSNGIHVRTESAPDFSLANRSTFRFLVVLQRHGGAPPEAGDPMLQNSIMNQVLRADVKHTLEARGYRPAPNAPADFDVAIYMAAHHALDIQTYDYGYSWRGWPYQYTQVTPYTRGTVIIDLVDPATHQLLWRGQGVAAVSDDPDAYQKELGKVVKAIVKKLPSRAG